MNRASVCINATMRACSTRCGVCATSGNSVIVVEHDEETIRAADHILDLGPGAGPRGGEIVAQGTIAEILRAKNSPTADYLSGRLRIAIPKQRVQPSRLLEANGRTLEASGWLTIKGATENNLKNVTLAFRSVASPA